MNRPETIRFDDFQLDLRTGELRRHGRRLRLQEKPFQVLAALLERPGELVTREDLRHRLWGGETFVDFDHNLNTAVYKLREALADTSGAPRYIETWPRKGYRFLGTLEAAPPPAETPPPRARRVAPLATAAAALLAFAAWVAVATRSSTSSTTSENPVAQEAFSKGRYFLAQGGPENLQRAAAYFEQSVAHDPGFARAHAELANTLAAYPSHRRDHTARARAASLEAIELDPGLADAHHRLASIYLYEDWNWQLAGEEFARAARLAPDSATIHYSYAGYLSLLGRHEQALTEMNHALRLDPANVAVSADAGWYWFVARRFDEAIAQSKKALELDPRHRGAHYYVLLSLIAKGDIVEARQWAARYLEILGGTPEEIERTTSGEASAGLRAFWEIRLARALDPSAEESAPAQELALLYAALGDSENALRQLEQAHAEHSGWLLPFMRVYPPLDGLRSHARFQAVQATMNFPS